jgi:hypothetical protein
MSDTPRTQTNPASLANLRPATPEDAGKRNPRACEPRFVRGSLGLWTFDESAATGHRLHQTSLVV